MTLLFLHNCFFNSFYKLLLNIFWATSIFFTSGDIHHTPSHTHSMHARTLTPILVDLIVRVVIALACQYFLFTVFLYVLLQGRPIIVICILGIIISQMGSRKSNGPVISFLRIFRGYLKWNNFIRVPIGKQSSSG